MTAPETRTRSPELDEAFDAELEAMALQIAEPVEEPREPSLSRYLKWQARDFVKHRGVFLLGIGLLCLWIFHHNYPLLLDGRARRGANGFTPAVEGWLFRNVVMGGSLVLSGLGSLMAAGQIVSRDREGGYQRFLFAKPVRIVSYYLQAFAVNGVGLLAVAATLALLTSATFLRAVPVGEALLGAGALYAAIGGLTFLLSTLVRFDVALAALLALVSFPLSQMAEQGRWWAVLTSWLLPPLYKLEAFGRNMSDGDVMRYSVVDAVSSLVVYGVAYVAAGVAVLKRRSIIR
jgi:hypothetical protein